MKKYKTPILITLGLALIIFLMILPKLNDPNRDTIKEWNQAGVECINDHQSIVSHDHAHLKINIDGEEERIPSEIGIVSSCMSEIHTHDFSGEIHIETASPGKDLTLGQFFSVWDKSIEREGYNLNTLLNGNQIKNPEELVLQDGYEIILNYTSISTSTES